MGIHSNLGNALFSKVQQRVLAILFGQPSQRFHTNEIIRLTHSGTGAVQRELAKLEAVGLLKIHQVGNQKQYQANQEAPIFSELRNIVLKTFGLADVLRETLRPFTSRIQVAFVYGSVAKQEDTTNSDIDLMLLGDNLSYAELYPLLEKVQIKLGRQINPTSYTPMEWARKRKEGNHFIAQILKQPKIFLIGTENELN